MHHPCRPNHAIKCISDPPLVPWVGVRISGTVVCGHCNGMHGRCRRGLLTFLYSIIAKADLVKNNTSCTSEQCSFVPFQSSDVSCMSGVHVHCICICRSDSPDSLSVVMHERKAVFIRFSPLNDLSAEPVMTGKVHMTLIRALILGYIEVVCLRAMQGRGYLASCFHHAACCRYCFHFNCQKCSSLWMQSADGRSPV